MEGRKVPKETTVVVVVIAGVFVLLLSACGGDRPAHLGLAECVEAWNGSDNAARRERVAKIIRHGYTRTGIQLSLSLGGMEANPVGCRVIFFNQDRWFGFLARRDEDQFRFRPAMLGAEEGDQKGVWPKGARRGPNNSRVVEGGKLVLVEPA